MQLSESLYIMPKSMPLPQTLQEAVLYASDKERVHDFMASMRWADGVECIHCECDRVGFISTRQKFKCKNPECRKQFSVKAGSVMEDSPLGLDKWFLATWMIANCKNGVSSYELHRELGITQKSAWFLAHRIRLAMQEGSLDKIPNEAEVDETYIGGKARSMHQKRWKRQRIKKNQGKSIVIGVLDRENRKVATKVIQDTEEGTLNQFVKENVEAVATVYTDGHLGYANLSKEDYLHCVINHAYEYVRGHIHTNGIENFWGLLKRTVKGTYVCPEEFHLFRYLDEQSFRYNYREECNFERVQRVLGGVAGKRVTYKKLAGKLCGMGNIKTA